MQHQEDQDQEEFAPLDVLVARKNVATLSPGLL